MMENNPMVISPVTSGSVDVWISWYKWPFLLAVKGKPCPYNTVCIIVGTPFLASETQTLGLSLETRNLKIS